MLTAVRVSANGLSPGKTASNAVFVLGKENSILLETERGETRYDKRLHVLF
jgi:hypothetical protein